MELSTLFERCLKAPYIRREDGIDFAAEYEKSRLFLYFEASDGWNDWKKNLDFPARPYRRMGKTVWYSHRGFLKTFKQIEPALGAIIADPKIKKITVTGYSHGAALAVFCHEYIWFHRPDLRRKLKSYGFGCPKVVWGVLPPPIQMRWADFTVIRNGNDLITHLPPSALGYTHIGKMLTLQPQKPLSPIDAHRPEQIMASLLLYKENSLCR